MKKIKKSHWYTNKKLLLSIAVVLVIAVGGIALAAVNNIGPFRANEPASETEGKNKPDDKKNNDENDNSPSSPPSKTPVDNDAEILPRKDDSETPSPPLSNQKRNAQVNIESTSQTSQNLKIIVSVENIDSNSSCALTMSRSGYQNYTETVDNQVSSSYSLCKGFTVPKSKLAKGQWQIKVTYASNNYQGSATKSVIVQ